MPSDNESQVGVARSPSKLATLLRRVAAGRRESTVSAVSNKSTLKRPKVVLPFGIILTSFMVSLACLVAPLSWHYTNSAGVSTSFDFSNKLQAALLNHAVSSITTRLDTAERLTGLQQRNWRTGNFDLSNKAVAMNVLFDRLKNNQDMVVTQSFTTHLGELNGYYTSLDPANKTNRIYRRWDTNGLNYTEYDIDVDDRVLSVTANDPAYNASTGDWVTIVDRNDPTSIGWTAVYIWQNIAWITQSRPIFNTAGQYIGVASSDLDLGFMGSLLTSRTKSIERPTSMYVFEAKSEAIIGTSSQVLDVFVRDGAGQATAAWTMKEIAEKNLDSVVKAIYTSLQARGQTLEQVSTTTRTIPSASNAGVSWIVSSQTIKWRTVHWVVFQVMAEEEVTRDINRGSLSTLGAVIGLLIGALFIVVIFALGFSHSLNRVTSQLTKIIEMDFGSIDPNNVLDGPHSRIKELCHIEESYVAMAKAFAKAAADNRSLRHRSSGHPTASQQVTASVNTTTASVTTASAVRGPGSFSPNAGSTSTAHLIRDSSMPVSRGVSGRY